MLVATSVAAIVLAGVLAAYLFMGRNLTRLANLQQQEMQSRRILRQFTTDLSAASQLSTATTSQIVLVKPTSGGTTTITYAYTAPSPSTAANGRLTRQDASGTQTLIRTLTSFTVAYYNEGGTAVTSSPVSVKSVELAFASAYGSASNGTLAAYNSVSPRVILRNKPALQ